MNFCPAITGAAAVDFDSDFPQIAQARNSSVCSWGTVSMERLTICLVCALLAICSSLVDLGLACGAGG